MLWLLTVITIIISTLVLIILHWYYNSYIITNEQIQVKTVVQELHRMINNICYRCEMSISYRIIVDDIVSFVEVNNEPNNYIHNIHLVVWNEQYKRPYNLNSLLLTILLELSVITGEMQLLKIAQQFGYYDETEVIEDVPGMRVII